MLYLYCKIGDSMKKKKKEIIHIDIEDMDDVYNCFNKNDLSEELQYYIEDQCGRTNSNEVIFRITTREELPEEEKERLVDTIRRHYGLDVRHCELQIKKNKIINILFFIIGVLLLFLLHNVQDLDFIPEVLDIVVCLVIWESIYNLIFKDFQIDLEVGLSKKIYTSRIEFKKRS